MWYQYHIPKFSPITFSLYRLTKRVTCKNITSQKHYIKFHSNNMVHPFNKLVHALNIFYHIILIAIPHEPTFNIYSRLCSLML